MSEIKNPKRSYEAAEGQSAFYPYYAGFSSEFARQILPVLNKDPEGVVFDPWNGAGTTTAACAELGMNAKGSDLNPSMVVVAKGRLLSSRTAGSVGPLAKRVLALAESRVVVSEANDPLRVWFTPRSADYIRRLESAIFETLISPMPMAREERLGGILTSSDLASFFYIGLFRTARELLTPRRSTNPTWLKKPKNAAEAVDVPQEIVHAIYGATMVELTNALKSSTARSGEKSLEIDIKISNSTNLDIEDGSVSAILTSPPYCTRIDYAIATAGECATLGILHGGDFEQLRASLMGTSMVPASVDQSLLWGPTCLEFLEKVYEHRSKASKTYYYKSHCQYFDSLYCSIEELARVLAPRGRCAMVVQNSHYKDVVNDLPEICAEMAETNGLELLERHEFDVQMSFSSINKKAKVYRSAGSREYEQVLVFGKPQ